MTYPVSVISSIRNEKFSIEIDNCLKISIDFVIVPITTQKSRIKIYIRSNKINVFYQVSQSF